MKKTIVLAIGMILIGTIAHAQSTRKVKTSVTFKQIGDYTTVNTSSILGDKSRTDTENEFEGKGLVNSAVAKMFLKSTNEGEITDLARLMIYELDHKKETYAERPIEQYTEEPVETEYEEESVEEDDSDMEQEEADYEDPIEVIRDEFKVTETGKTKDINRFNCSLYTIEWLREWRNTESGETGTDSLYTEVWTTPVTGEMQRAQQAEQQFYKTYMEKLGFSVDLQAIENYGLNWVQMLGQMDNEASTGDINWDNRVSELAKIEGYPVVTDGKYFAIRPDKNKEEEEKSSVKSVVGVKKLFGRFAKKAVKKQIEAPKTDGPDVHYYTELLEYSAEPLGAKWFEVPENYKLKK